MSISSFKVEVVKIEGLKKHPNADTLDVIPIFGFTAIAKSGLWKDGDLVAYIPVDAVVPDKPEWAWLNPTEGKSLGKYARVKAKKLRGVFSMGLLTAAPERSVAGDDVAEKLGVTKYEEPEETSTGGNAEREPAFIPRYTNIDSARRYAKDVFVDGEEVIVTEKIHGANGRWLWYEDRFWAGSHRQIKRSDIVPETGYERSMWHRAANQIKLPEILKEHPGLLLYGEVYGQVQDLKYGTKPGELRLAFFDVYSVEEGEYLDHDFLVTFCNQYDLPRAPVLYRGPYSAEVLKLAEGPTVAGAGAHFREGIVIKPVKERYQHCVGRCVLKFVSETYLLRKGGTEGH